jgi:S1-C subfamily serine protease/photosystem II stability/assembly factor-like uncharacterized protein
MSSHHPLLHSYDWLVLLTAILGLAGIAWLPAQERQPAAQQGGEKSGEAKEREQRLEQIEKSLQSLLNEVQALQKPAAQPRGSAAESSSTSNSATAATKANPDFPLDPQWLKSLNWRCLGPANMGGRITDIAVNESDSSMWWIATASGGLLKTVNNGITFEHQFDHEATVSIGAIAVAPSDANVVWVGAGEANPRNSVSYGDGVYQSTDGGKTWKNMGLNKTYQIGGLVVHPKNPDIVYVGALGRLYGPSEDRGVYKTSDGGKTWQKVLYIDDRTGVIDLVMHPSDPETLIAALWDRQRDGYDSWPGDVPKPDGIDGYDPIRKWGASGGLYKTTDGGKNWKKLKDGLPSNATGRIGIDWYQKDGKIVFAIIDCESIGKGPPALPVYLGAVGADVEGKAKVTQVLPESPAAKAGLAVGDVISALGDKEISGFDQLLDELRTKKPRDKIALQVVRGGEKKTIETALTTRPAAGGTGAAAASRVWLGVTGADREGKATLTQIVPNGPGAKAGLKEGDVVVAIEGKEIDDYDKLLEAVRGKDAGDKIALKIGRGNESLDVSVTLEDRPAGQFGGRGGGGGGGAAGQPQSDVYLGIQGADGPEGGAKLTQISEAGPAEKAGLEDNDIVQAIDGQKIADYEALVAAIGARKAGDKMKLTVLRGSETKQIEVTLETRPGGPTRTRPYTFSYFGQSPNVQDQQGAKGYEYGGVYRSDDGGETWQRVNSLNTRPMYFSVIRVDPSDANKVYVLGVSHFQSTNGGLTFTNDYGRGTHADGHALWIDPRDGRHMLLGCDGGFYASYDRGRNWDHINTTALGQFYHVAIGLKEPYWVVGGLQDNGSWGGPAISKSGGVINEDWLNVGGGDGFVCRVDADDPDLIYSESQNGTISRRHLRTGERAAIRPTRPRGAAPYRFNWNAPFVLSSHNAKIFYSAGNFVFRSLDRGNNLQVISPEITLTKRGSATALAESTRNPNILYVGTDDGALWVTRDGGHEWKDITKNLGIRDPRWVATIEASRYADGRVYVTLDGHRSDDDEPYAFVSEDFGQTFKSIRTNLPWGSTRCLREDIQNENLLFCGTEFGLWTSLDRGAHWTKLNNNLPTVAVHEVAMHPTNGEIVAATHGRSLWASDISALRQLSAEQVKEKITLFKPAEVIRWQSEPARGRTNRRFAGTNPAAGAQLWYALPKKAERVTLRIEDIEGRTVRELRGSGDVGLNRVAWDLLQSPQTGTRGQGTGNRGQGSGNRGQGSGVGSRGSGVGNQGTGTGGPGTVNRPQGTVAGEPATEPQRETVQQRTEQPSEQQEEGERPAAGQRGGRGGPGGGGRPAPNGSYRVVLVVDGRAQPPQFVRLERDPHAPPSAVLEAALQVSEADAMEEEEEEEEREREEEEAERRDRIDD